MTAHRLIRWTAALTLPFALVFGTVLTVDPYDYFNLFHAVPDALKRKNLYHDGRTMPFSNLLWKLVELRRTPQDRLLLGDSRLSHFDLDLLDRVTGHRWYNLGVPGGNTRTMADLFSFASQAPLKEVVVQVSFRGMNRGMDWDLYGEPRMLLDRPFLYLSNRRVLEATLLNLRSAWAPSTVQYDVLPPDHWRRVLDMERANADGFALDSAAFGRLGRIAERCRAMGCSVRFVEWPTHPDVQRIYAEAGLGPEREAYMERLRRLAPVTDLDLPGLFPPDTALWRDPLHLTTAAQRLVIDTVWGGAGR